MEDASGGPEGERILGGPMGDGWEVRAQLGEPYLCLCPVAAAYFRHLVRFVRATAAATQVPAEGESSIGRTSAAASAAAATVAATDPADIHDTKLLI